ncbi:MAG: hypothetical protein EZS28_018261, partial [Streblomastix strix]
MYLTGLLQKVFKHDFDSEDVRDAIATYDCDFVFLHKMPQLWLDYIDFLVRNKQITLTHRTIDQALRFLPTIRHHLIWTSQIKLNLRKENNIWVIINLYNSCLSQQKQYSPAKLALKTVKLI